MVERQMRSSILAIGSYWYSAWVDAGQPDLNKMDKLFPIEQSEQDSIRKAEQLFINKSKVLGRPEE